MKQKNDTNGFTMKKNWTHGFTMKQERETYGFNMKQQQKWTHMVSL